MIAAAAMARNDTHAQIGDRCHDADVTRRFTGPLFGGQRTGKRKLRINCVARPSSAIAQGGRQIQVVDVMHSDAEKLQRYGP